MDLLKLKLYLEILTICLTVVLTYVIVVKFITAQEVHLYSFIILGLNVYMMLYRNDVFWELWGKWTKKD